MTSFTPSTYALSVPTDITSTAFSATSSTFTTSTESALSYSYATSVQSTSSSNPTTSAAYHQIISPGQNAQIDWSIFVQSDFDALCPSHDCVQDCQNYTRVFEEVPYLITESFDEYGKAVDGGAPDITLFGVCSNLASVYDEIFSGTNLLSKESYFPSSGEGDVVHVSTTLTSCLASTCDSSREPDGCMPACNMTLLYDDSGSMNITAVTACLIMLCSNTCGLPYANQDVMGVGVLWSYYIQAGFALLCAALSIGQALCYTFRRKPAAMLSENNKRGLNGFLAAQCYFTIALEIAALYSKPWETDALTGYALLSVGITGFLCPIFTLMLLHIYGCRSLYAIFWTGISYLLATIVFWFLFRNLSTHFGSTTSSDETLQHLYEITSCGGSSAIALCPQTIGNDPLHYLAAFYNKSSIPNLRKMPLLWGWSTFILILLVTDQVYHNSGSTKQNKRTKLSNPGLQSSTSGLFTKSFAQLITLFVPSIVFLLALMYQEEMLQQYSRSDVINWHGWSFGQIVAVVIWLQPLIDYLTLWIRDYKDHNKGTNNPAGTTTQPPKVQSKGGYIALSQRSPSNSMGTSATASNTPNPQASSPGLQPTSSLQTHHSSITPFGPPLRRLTN